MPAGWQREGDQRPEQLPVDLLPEDPEAEAAAAELEGGARRRSSASSSAPRRAACRAARGRRRRGGRAPRRRRRPRAGLDRAPGEIAILAARLAAERLGVEAVDELEQLPRIGHVAGRKRGVERVHGDRARERPKVTELQRVRQRPALNEAARVGERRRPPSRPSQPGVGAQSSSVNAISAASLARQPSSRAVAGPAEAGRAIMRSGNPPRARSAASTASSGRGAVGDHDDLVGGPLLLGQRPQQPREPCGAIVRGDDDRDRRSHGRNA